IHEGDDVAGFEGDLARFLGVEHAVAMPQARVGIYFTLKYLTRTKKKVVLSPYTIHDVINMVICAGATPVFADIDRETCNIDTAEVAKLVDDDTGAVMVTHLHGLACDIEGVAKICQERGVPLVEDTAQALGATVNGRRLGTFGDAGIFSFGMAKNVNSLYGGAVTTNRADLAAELRANLAGLPYQDKELLLKRAAFCLTGDVMTADVIFPLSTFWLFRFGYLHQIEALNKRWRGEDAPTIKTEIPETYLRRMTPMQARLLRTQLPQIDASTAVRLGYARRYDAGLRDVSEIIIPPLREDGSHIYLNYPIQVPDRHALLRYLMQHGRDLTVQHMGNNADYDTYVRWHRDCPNARATGTSVLLLPSYTGYGDVEVDKNIALVRRYFEEQRAKHPTTMSQSAVA
ncbi:MAG TPA: DegT/DnrJ/EryC1/StrS family aminotransferase, partial [Kofleriaceae bacterium]|nr:DegT/DnrJ/EryC1/StrS family aminotransferase [Kofleriaceae bacterium]